VPQSTTRAPAIGRPFAAAMRPRRRPEPRSTSVVALSRLAESPIASFVCCDAPTKTSRCTSPSSGTGSSKSPLESAPAEACTITDPPAGMPQNANHPVSEGLALRLGVLR
jgi:hypothetical protein